MHIPLVDLKAQYATIKPEIDAAIQRVLDNTAFIQGKEVADFERAFAAYVETKGAAGVASGTSALQLALLACGVGPGDEVITVSHTFIATAEAISQVGATPIFVDVDPKTYTMDPLKVEPAITSRTRAIIPVHLYGQPADLDPLMEIAKRHNLYLIEDAAQAHGAEYRGRRIGSIGHMACFSFYPGKNLGGYGDGGMVTSNDETLLNKVRRSRDHGRTTKYEHEEIGWGERLDGLQAAVLGVKLQHLEKWTEARRAIARSYKLLLEDTSLILPYEAPHVRHVNHVFAVRLTNRDSLLAFLKERGIDAGIHYPVPVHKQVAYQKLGLGNMTLPVTEQLAAEVLSLPLYPELTPEQQTHITEAVKEWLAMPETAKVKEPVRVTA